MNISYFQRFKNFDEVTEFRLKNAFIVALGMALLGPILISLKGVYLVPWIIAAFSIVQTLSIKMNGYVVKTFTLGQMYKMGIFIHILFVINSIIYFYSPVVMVWLDGIIALIEVAIFSSYSIKLNTYITDFYPDTMSTFQIVRNSTWADGYLIGLGIVTVLTYLGGVTPGIIAFICHNTFFSMWLIYHWNFFENIDY